MQAQRCAARHDAQVSPAGGSGVLNVQCVKDVTHIGRGYDHMDAWGYRWPITEGERNVQAARAGRTAESDIAEDR